MKSSFVYVIYIAATAEKVWKALLDGQFTRQYWGAENISDWQPGSPWEHRRSTNGSTMIVGEVLEATPPHRLVVSWADPKYRADKSHHSRLRYEIENVGDQVRLTITHDELDPEMAGKISRGWPLVLSNLKSLLETGKAYDIWADKRG